MKATLFTLTIALAAATATAPAFARDALPQATQQALALKDGSTLYVFKDGKMARRIATAARPTSSKARFSSWPTDARSRQSVTRSRGWTGSSTTGTGTESRRNGPPTKLHREAPMNKLGKAGFVSALVLAASAVIAGPGHDSNPVGEPGKAAQATRTVNVDMTDNMRFTPSEISVKQGETVRIVVKNSGAVKHELVLGTPEELKEHYAMMLKMPGMEHADDNMVSVAPGETGEVVWRFTRAGKVDFACLQPGHYDAGMKGLVTVAQGTRASKNDGHGGHKH